MSHPRYQPKHYPNFNEEGEPLISGEALRFEAALDEQYAAQERMLDDDYYPGDYDEGDDE